MKSSYQNDGRPTGAKFELVHAEALLLFPELVRELGGDPLALLCEARIDPSVLSKRGSAFEYWSFVQVMEFAAKQLCCPDFGLRFAALQDGRKVIGPIGVVMNNSKTLGQALGYCAKNIHAYSLATRVYFKPDRSNHRLFVGLDILLGGTLQQSQATEHALLLANRNAIEITGGEARVKSVSFRHKPLMNHKAYTEYFGCEVLFGQDAVGIVFTESDLLCPIVQPDEQVYEMATSYIDARYPQAVPQLHARVHSWVSERLGRDECTCEGISAELCMHPRTLQRRLKAEGKSFQSIKDDVRREVALQCLQQTEMPLGRIAEKLGYADASVFSRCCCRWFGASPGQLRRAPIDSAALT